MILTINLPENTGGLLFDCLYEGGFLFTAKTGQEGEDPGRDAIPGTLNVAPQVFFMPLFTGPMHPNNLAVTNILLNCFFIALFTLVKYWKRNDV